MIHPKWHFIVRVLQRGVMMLIANPVTTVHVRRHRQDSSCPVSSNLTELLFDGFLSGLFTTIKNKGQLGED